MPASSAYGYYYVSGVVGFTYSSYSSKVGGVTTSTQSWSEQYALGFGSSIVDPRFLLIGAGIGYQVSHFSGGEDSNILTYSLNADFFPGRMISWKLYGNKSISNMPSVNNLAGYDVETTSFGATADLRLSAMKKRGNNNNYFNNNRNNSNNNNNRRGFQYTLPDLTLSVNHTEAQSFSQLEPMHETRDNATANMRYTITPDAYAQLDGMLEEYKNLRTGYSYDSRSLALLSNIDLKKNRRLVLTGRLTEREYDFQTTGGREKESGQAYTIFYDSRVSNRFSHIYSYGYSHFEVPAAETLQQDAQGGLQYRILPDLILNVSLRYSDATYTRKETALLPKAESNVKTGTLSSGVNYVAEYKPEFMDPFAIRVNYTFDSGFSDVHDAINNVQTSGWFYQNTAGLGLFSVGWQYESLNLSSAYTVRRDHSGYGSNTETQSYSLNVQSSRVPRTRIYANASYTLAETTSGNVPNPTQPLVFGTSSESRTLQYTAGLDYAIAAHLNFIAGASQVNTRDTTLNYTLATLAMPGAPEVTQERYYAMLNSNFALTRTITCKLSLEDEWQKTKPIGREMQSYIVNAGLDWRIRKIYLNLDYRWRRDMPAGSVDVQQQYFFARISRPF